MRAPGAPSSLLISAFHSASGQAHQRGSLCGLQAVLHVGSPEPAVWRESRDGPRRGAAESRHPSRQNPALLSGGREDGAVCGQEGEAAGPLDGTLASKVAPCRGRGGLVTGCSPDSHCLLPGLNPDLFARSGQLCALPVDAQQPPSTKRTALGLQRVRGAVPTWARRLGRDQGAL